MQGPYPSAAAGASLGAAGAGCGLGTYKFCHLPTCQQCMAMHDSLVRPSRKTEGLTAGVGARCRGRGYARGCSRLLLLLWRCSLLRLHTAKGCPRYEAPYRHWVPGEMEGATGMQWPCAYPGDHDDHEVLMSDLVVLQGGVVLEHLHGQAKNVSPFIPGRLCSSQKVLA